MPLGSIQQAGEGRVAIPNTVPAPGGDQDFASGAVSQPSGEKCGGPDSILEIIVSCRIIGESSQSPHIYILRCFPLGLAVLAESRSCPKNIDTK